MRVRPEDDDEESEDDDEESEDDDGESEDDEGPMPKSLCVKFGA